MTPFTSLAELASAIGVPAPSGADADPAISSITTSSDDVTPGALFIAVRGTRTDGHDFVEDAVRGGASAVVVERNFEGDPGVPALRVDGSRRAAAELAAAWHGRPAERLSLVGITGSLGKTSVLSMLEAILAEAGRRPGSVGSLGVRVAGEAGDDTGHTAPGPLLLHRELARLADEACDPVIMEATSHALVQERLHGLRFDLGVFTNLVPLEHSEYHATFEDYVAAKRLFFRHLPPEAPLVYNVDDRPSRRLVHDADAAHVGCGTARAAMVRLHPDTLTAEGTRMEIEVRCPLPRTDGGRVEPVRFGVELRLLGRGNLANAGLAATAALCLGVAPDAVARALARFPPPPRRMQVVRREPVVVLDDTVGHPDSVSAVFEVARALAPGRIHVAFAVRGARGPRLNGNLAGALAVAFPGERRGELVVTPSVDAADARNRVTDEEMEAFTSALRESGTPFRTEPRLRDAVERVTVAAEPGDAVLLLGAQGMDAGAGLATAAVSSPV